MKFKIYKFLRNLYILFSLVTLPHLVFAAATEMNDERPSRKRTLSSDAEVSPSKKRKGLVDKVALIQKSLEDIVDRNSLPSEEEILEYVRTFIHLSVSELDSLCKAIYTIYDSECYDTFTEYNDPHNWIKVANALSVLSDPQQALMCDLISCTPESLQIPPADVIEYFHTQPSFYKTLDTGLAKHSPERPTISKLSRYGFEKHPDTKLKVLHYIIKSLSKKFPPEDIKKGLTRKIPSFKTFLKRSYKPRPWVES